jgi:hypothetical protein
MKRKLVEHILSMAFVTVVLVAVLFLINAGSNARTQRETSALQTYGSLSFVDFSSSFHKALLKDAVNIYYPDQYEKNNVTVENILTKAEDRFGRKLRESGIEEKLSFGKFVDLLGMFLKFVLVYAVVMGLTYYGVQTLAVFRFTRKKMRSVNNGKKSILELLSRAGRAVGKTAAYFVLFSPAYVIAYSIRTEFNTDTIVFMALLGVISNGLLVTYANKFYAFLVAESRKGYVETAFVKNLAHSYSPHDKDGVRYPDILRPFKRFDGHVFGHIFANARFQYFSAIKEQASFLISGLIIIEMALNIHGHLSYEMLRQMLYKNYDIVIVIILGIFYIVKATEIAVDYVVFRAEKRIENK